MYVGRSTTIAEDIIFHPHATVQLLDPRRGQ